MQFEFVLVKELKFATTKNTNKQYPVIVDQAGNIWRLFNGEQVELNKAYTFGYDLSEDKQFKNVKQIIPLANVFKIQALKEVANKNDIIRNYSIAITQSIQIFAIGQKMPTTDELFRLSTSIYDHIEKFVDGKMPKES